MSLLLLFHETLPVGPVNGDLAVTEINDTLGAVVTLEVAASLVATEANDVASSAGTVALAASVAIAEFDDTLNASVTLPIVGIVAAAEGDDVPSAGGMVDIVGTLLALERDDAISAPGALGIAAFLAVIEEDDTLSVSALMPIWYPRRGGDDEWARHEQRQIEWEQQLRQIIDRSWQIANGEIDPITFVPIPPPDHSAVVGEMINQALAIGQARAQAFVAERERMQEDEAISILLLAA